tara:strand:+ start:211 stop:585 length:375 start_codon:yes stop_codon:yes gene_type:complete
MRDVREQDYGGIDLEGVTKDQQLHHNKLLRQQQELINNIVLIIEHIVQVEAVDQEDLVVEQVPLVAVDQVDQVVLKDMVEVVDLLAVAAVEVKVDKVVHMVIKDLKDMLVQDQQQEVGIMSQVH